MMKRIMSIAALLCVFALSAQEKPEEVKSALPETKSFEWPIKFNQAFVKGSKEFIRDASYNRPYLLAGMAMLVRPWSWRKLETNNPGHLSFRLTNGRWLAGTLVVGLGLKALGHKLMVDGEREHRHTGFMLDYSGMFKNENCKSID